MQLLLRILHQGLTVSPIFAVPYLTNKQFLLDWLHVADQGVSASFLAGLFYFVLPKMPGQTDLDRVSHLYKRMHDYYRSESVQSRLDNLTLKMLGPRKKPKLRAKAAECRALITFAYELARDVLNRSDTLENSVYLATLYLQRCYANLSPEVYQKSHLADACRRFCLLLVQLEQHSDLFRVKPKLHLFQELCELSDVCPSKTWCYRDEDFGGSLASISKVRGGPNRAANIAKAVLTRFFAQHKLPRL
jgi:hypothetical protein